MSKFLRIEENGTDEIGVELVDFNEYLKSGRYNEKKAFWQEKLGVEFDKYGRAVIGTVIQNDTKRKNELAYIFHRHNFDPVMERGMAKYMQEKKYIGILDVNGYKEKIEVSFMGCVRAMRTTTIDKGTVRFEKVKDDGSTTVVKVKTSTVFSAIKEHWISENPDYDELCSEIKKLRKEGNNFSNCPALSILSNQKKDMEKECIYFEYDRWQNEATEKSNIYLTINPLDVLTASGENDYNPTKFSTCWDLKIYTCDDNEYLEDKIVVEKEGCYAYPISMLALNQIKNRALIYIENGNELVPFKSSDYTMKGYQYRVHCWYDENINKVTHSRLYPKGTSENIFSNVNIPLVDSTSVYKDGTKIGINDWDGICKFLSASEYNEYDHEAEAGIFLDREYYCDEDDCFKGLSSNRLEYEYNEGIGNPQLGGTVCEDCGARHCEEDMYYIEDHGFVCESCCNDNYRRCYHCEELIHTESVMYIEDVQEYVCRECVDNNYYFCDGCNEYHRYSTTYVECDDVELCDSCLEEKYTYCTSCEEWHRESNVREIQISKYEYINVCEDCYQDYVECEECGYYDRQVNVKYINDENLCNECYEEKYMICDKCGEDVLRDAMHYHDDMSICCKCFEEIETEELIAVEESNEEVV